MHVPCPDTADELRSGSGRAHRRAGGRARATRDPRIVDPEWALKARKGEPFKPFGLEHIHQPY
ncbi:hypothetical protein WMF37_50040 [Sorangium sp. So ce291]|uniref:hypothetical protein n=1 Tax=Sorangium sp. So ce291 TaxID=3133294 RepID=UPI003F5D9E26